MALGLPVQDFTTLVRNMATAMKAACADTLDFTTGTVLRALLEANASVALWLQWLTLQMLARSRAATSTGADLDSWMADFGVARLPATSAGGAVVMSRLTPGFAASIPVGASVRSADGTARFSVAADASNPAWTGSGYTLAANATAVGVPVRADAPGSAGNLPAGSLNTLATAIAGVDGVSNPVATAGGLDAESDASLRARFGSFIDSRSRATRVAVAYAVQSVRQGLRLVISENQLPDGSARLGSFVVTVDDGTGTPPLALLQAVTSAVDAVRPLGSVFSVRPPALAVADIQMAIRLLAPATLSDVAGPISSTVTSWVSGLPIGAPLPRSRLIQLAFDASSSVTDVFSVQVNGASDDLVPGATGLVLPGSVTLSVAP